MLSLEILRYEYETHPENTYSDVIYYNCTYSRIYGLFRSVLAGK
jgi:hypothetical protein